jgi:hypothetical protein
MSGSLEPVYLPEGTDTSSSMHQDGGRWRPFVLGDVRAPPRCEAEHLLCRLVARGLLETQSDPLAPGSPNDRAGILVQGQLLGVGGCTGPR